MIKNIQNKNIQALICIVTTSFSALTTHIYISQLTKPILDTLIQNSLEQNLISNPNPSEYPAIIIYASYATALVTTGFLVFCYYHTQHLIPGRFWYSKTIYTAAIIFGIKGELIRQPIMDYILNYTIGLNNPLVFVIMNSLDQWLANLLLALCLVCLCPQKK